MPTPSAAEASAAEATAEAAAKPRAAHGVCLVIDAAAGPCWPSKGHCQALTPWSMESQCHGTVLSTLAAGDVYRSRPNGMRLVSGHVASLPGWQIG